MKTKTTIRTFESGGVRDTSEGKLDYYGFRHPLLEQSFAKYMHEHRKLPDGSFRDADNWWKGWDKKISLQSMIRHLEDLQAIDAGYYVYEVRRVNGEVQKYYVKSTSEFIMQEGDSAKMIFEDDACNAIRFNATAYLLEYIKTYDQD